MRTPLIFALACSATLLAHPLGNFSVNHYMRFEAAAGGVEMRYVMDLAEIPTFELLRDWGLERTSPRKDLERKAAEQARLWMGKLALRVDGKPVKPVFEDASFVIADGAGNLPILRVTTRMRAAAAPGHLQYEDHNFEGRAGWKEIVIAAGPGARLESASQSDRDRSQALSAYPPDPLTAPPQDLRAEFAWTSEAVISSALSPQAHSSEGGLQTPAPPAPVIRAIPQPVGPAAAAPAAMTAKNAPAGTVVKNDFLSRLLHREEIPLNMVLIALVIAFGLGAAHALTPGHGKTIVAAYLVGSRGTLKHAAFLGAMVTLTHTISVFALGLATLFLFRFIVPEKITEILGVISGLSIAMIGGWMLWKRLGGATGHAHGHSHDHVHAPHDHTHDHGHVHALANGHTDDHSHTHDHVHAPADGHTHTHEAAGHTHDHGRDHDHMHTLHAHEATAHTHDHSHDHDHVHALTDGHTHTHEAAGHSHDHGHNHDHVHTLAHGHTHTHEAAGHTHNQGHDHDHMHTLADDHTHTHEATAHTHDYGHDHDQMPMLADGHTHMHEAAAYTHDHSHTHDHEHALADGHTHTHEATAHTHDHGQDHDHVHAPAAHDHSHHHGPGGHSHVPEGDISWGSLIPLAISGGLVPCESALVLLLSAISLGRAGLGLLLLLSFSLGLAAVLMGIGMMVLYAKSLLPQRTGLGQSAFMRWTPVASAVVVVMLGVLMTTVSLGWLPSGWQIG